MVEIFISHSINEGNDPTNHLRRIAKITDLVTIIKKFLYSDHEIFLRELVSNAVDATQKLKALSALGEAKGELGDIKVEVADHDFDSISKGKMATSLYNIKTNLSQKK